MDFNNIKNWYENVEKYEFKEGTEEQPRVILRVHAKNRIEVERAIDALKEYIEDYPPFGEPVHSYTAITNEGK